MIFVTGGSNAVSLDASMNFVTGAGYYYRFFIVIILDAKCISISVFDDCYKRLVCYNYDLFIRSAET